MKAHINWSCHYFVGCSVMCVHFFAKAFSLWDYKLATKADNFTLPLILSQLMYTCACSSEWLHVHSLGQPHCWCCSWYNCTAGRGSWVTPVFFWNGCHYHKHARLSQKWRPCCEFEVLEQDMILVFRLMDSKFSICKITMFSSSSRFNSPFLPLPFPLTLFPFSPFFFLYPHRWSPNHAMGVSISSWTICRRLVWKWHGWRKTTLNSTNRQWKTILRWCACDLAREIIMMCFSL